MYTIAILKGVVALYLMIYLNSDIEINYSVCLPEVPLEGNVYRIFNICLSFYLVSKIGEHFVISFSKFYIFNSYISRIKTETYKI